MVPEMEKPRITEIKVGMESNGCVHKMKKGLHGITGIYDLYVAFPQQKITIIGWAEPEKIVKAIRKTRKSAIICSHIQQPESGTAEADGGEPPPPPPAAAPPLPSREEIHVIYHHDHPPDYGNWYAYQHYYQPVFGGGLPQPVHVTHSDNTYKASPFVAEYACLYSLPAYTHFDV